MKRCRRLLSALLALLLLSGGPVSVPSSILAAAASDAVSESAAESGEESAASSISLTVSIFENVGRRWLLSPTQLSVPDGTGLGSLLSVLNQYAFLEDVRMDGSEILSITDEDGDVFPANPSVGNNWIMVVNGIEYPGEEGLTPPAAFSDGDTVQLVYESGGTAETDLSAVSTPDRTLSSATGSLPWEDSYEYALTTGSSWLRANVQTPFALTVLGACGVTVDHRYLTQVLREISEDTSPSGTQLAQDILAVTFSGISAENFSGRDLIAEMLPYPDLGRIESILGLIAYDSNQYEIPTDALNSRSAMLNVIMAGQNEDGGIAQVQGEESSVILTAFALISLAPYRDDATVGPCIEKALQWLAGEMGEDCLFSDQQFPSCTATGAVILALSSLSVPLTDERFTVGDQNLLTALMQFYNEGTGFSERTGRDPDAEATGMALLALESQRTGRNPLVLSSPITGSGTIDFSVSETVSEESSSEPLLDQETRMKVRVGLVAAVGGAAVAALAMLGVLLHWRNKYKKKK